MLTTCKHFDMVGNRCSRVTGGKCDDLPDCEFKYIEELKAENETLKSQLDFEVQKKEVLEAENERLKLKTEELENRMQTLDDEDITVEITEDEFEKYKQLKSCLQEIKAIAENCYDPADKENDGFYTILQLITKAESEEEQLNA